MLTVPGNKPEEPPGDVVQELPAEDHPDSREANEHGGPNLAMSLTSAPVLDVFDSPRSVGLGPIQKREAPQAGVLGSTGTNKAPETEKDSTAVETQDQTTAKRSLKPQVSFFV